MQFLKGQPKTAGRKKGSRNKTTIDQRERIQWVLSLSEKRIESDMEKLSPIDNVKIWTALQQYLLPKFYAEKMEKEKDDELQKVELTQKIVYRALTEAELETGEWKNE